VHAIDLRDVTDPDACTQCRCNITHQVRTAANAGNRTPLLSIAADDAHLVAWCRIQELCINSAESHYRYSICMTEPDACTQCRCNITHQVRTAWMQETTHRYRTHVHMRSHAASPVRET
jgi:hypothetical protein